MDEHELAFTLSVLECAKISQESNLILPVGIRRGMFQYLRAYALYEGREEKFDFEKELTMRIKKLNEELEQVI
ncbi:hypothetical protein LCGC14_1562980, partial [marine sediment metagenome]